MLNKRISPILLLALLAFAFGCAVISPTTTLSKKGAKTTLKTVKKAGDLLTP